MDLVLVALIHGRQKKLQGWVTKSGSCCLRHQASVENERRKRRRLKTREWYRVGQSLIARQDKRWWRQRRGLACQAKENRLQSAMESEY